MPRRSKRSNRHETEAEDEDDAEFNDNEIEQEPNHNNDEEDHEDHEDHEEEEDDEDHDDEEEEDDDNYQRKNRRKSRKKKKRAKVMSASNQTDAQRRELRSKQRRLYTKMTDATTDIGEQMGHVDSHVFQSVREENNKLWKNVKYTREAVLDGDNVDYISSRATRQVDQLISVPRYSADSLSNAIKAKCHIRINSTTKVFDWKKFGLEVGSCFNSLPTYCSFLNGPINAEYKPKERKKPIRRQKEEDDGEEEEVDTVNQQQKSKNKDANKLSAVEKQIQTLSKTLKKRDEQERSKLLDLALQYENQNPHDMDDSTKKKFMKRIKKSNALSPCAIQFVMNPDSFTQTVENLFGLSFAVKKGNAEVGVRKYEECKEYGLGTVPGPYVRHHKPKSGPQGPARQAIISFNMQDWRDLKEAYNIEKGDIPHRGKSKRAKVGDEE